MEITHRSQLGELALSLGMELDTACEIGCAEGLYSADLLRMGFQKLYMVDVYAHIPNVRGDGNSSQEWHDQNLYKAKIQVADFGDKAVFLKGKSVDMAVHVADESLSLLYLDADHSYNGVMSDLNAWFPKVKQGGIVAMHDYEMPQYGVKQAVQDFCRNKYEIHLLPENKKEDAGAWFIKT